MLYVSTGGNGAGKTLFTVWDVRQEQIRSGRAVFFHGFNALSKLLDEFGWKLFEPSKWQELPDGSICIFDEAQNDFPPRKQGAPVPDWIEAIAQHRRRRGFDFWICTPHVSMLDIFIRRLIQAPSWHRHFKRLAGGGAVSELKYSFANGDADKPDAGQDAETTLRKYPKEAYGWYESATIHTVKWRVPRAVWIMAACGIAVPALGWFGYRSMVHSATGGAVSAGAKPSSAPGGVAAAPAPRSDRPRTGGDLMATMRPRIPDVAWSAPRYDAITVPVRAPVVVGCWWRGEQVGGEGWCITQQGTRVHPSAVFIKAFLEGGQFVDFDRGPDVVSDRSSSDKQTGGPKGANSAGPAGVGG
jgi:zona occludens toxin